MQQPDELPFSRESLNGREYNVYVIRKAQLYPLQEGKAELESAMLENKIRFLKYSGASDPGTLVTETVNLSSKPAFINVKALPEAGKPVSFRGAVGNFRMEAITEKKFFSADETGKLILKIAGTGNMHLLTLPEIKWPENFEAFDPRITEDIDNGVCPISGSKTFEIPFSVQAPGKYTLPPVVFSYFDPATASYKTITSKPVGFTVLEGKNPVSSFASPMKESEAGFFEKIAKNRLLIILFSAGILIAALIFWMTGERKNETVNTVEDASNAPVDYMHEAVACSTVNPLLKTSECLADPECVEFYSLLNTELKRFFANRLGLEEILVNAKTVSVAMDKAGIDNDTSLLAQKLLRDINLHLYTPFEDNEQLNDMYARAQTVIQMVNTQRFHSVNL
jgi:hypothetical protein